MISPLIYAAPTLARKCIVAATTEGFHHVVQLRPYRGSCVRLINIVARCVGSPVAKNLTRCALDRLHYLVSYILLHDKAVETAKALSLIEIQKNQKKQNLECH